MAIKSRRLSSEELSLFKWVVGSLMGLVSVSTVFNTSNVSHVPGALCCACIVASLLFPWAFSKMPSYIWTLFAIAIVPLTAVDVLSKETLPSLLNLNTWLILYRTLNHNRRREEMQLVLLCLFFLIMTGIMTSSLVFGAQLFAFSALAIAFLGVGAMLESKIEGDYDQVADHGAWSFKSIVATFGKALAGGNLLMGFMVFSSLLLVGALTFMVIPRIDVENRISLFDLSKTSSLTGFNEKISLGEITDIKKDRSVALRVDVDSKEGIPIEPYWRMLALDTYSEGSFSLSPMLKESLKTAMASPYTASRYWPDKKFSASVSSEENIDRWTFFQEPGVSKFLPILGEFKRFTYGDIDHLKLLPFMHSFSLSQTNGRVISYQLEGVDFSGKVRDLSTGGFPVFVSRILSKATSDPEGYPHTLLQLPDEALAQDYLYSVVEHLIGNESVAPIEFAKRATDFLQEKHRYSMSIQLDTDTDIQDPVVRWMRSEKPGHCEFFASSLVLLARTAGYPTRAVVGFKGGTWNTFENYFMIRNSDAHAWCEMYDGESSWFRVDPTPGSPEPDEAPLVAGSNRLLNESDSMAYIDSLKMLWYRRIVNFDQEAQQEAALQLKDFFLAYMDVAENWFSNAYGFLVDWLRGPWSILRILYLLFLVSLLVSAYVIQYSLALNYREMASAWFRRGDPIRRKAGRLLQKANNRRRESVDSERLGSLLEDLKRLRFGRRESWPKARHVFKEARRLL